MKSTNSWKSLQTHVAVVPFDIDFKPEKSYQNLHE